MNYYERIVERLKEAEHLARTALNGNQRYCVLSGIDNALAALGAEPIFDPETGELIPEAAGPGSGL